jgi:hypothetical protein
MKKRILHYIYIAVLVFILLFGMVKGDQITIVFGITLCLSHGVDMFLVPYFKDLVSRQ